MLPFNSCLAVASAGDGRAELPAPPAVRRVLLALVRPPANRPGERGLRQPENGIAALPSSQR